MNPPYAWNSRRTPTTPETNSPGRFCSWVVSRPRFAVSNSLFFGEASGKGTEDIGVIHFGAWKQIDGSLTSLANPNTFAVGLPRTPWSYDGELIKIHWLTRVRVRFGPDRKDEVVQDTEFTLAPPLPRQS